ncbi:MFS transporter [Dactylosporangium vinaceum]|uniref:MFS transporter n=1 Tax=Dactylosporangium vinaceum TaxID=53362 RepID=A0ABV5M2Z9_9ACTN|nr:MFS transporter [Dactylosporangium vinaceum]UAB99828.1 MFS transporter [Dactylosporangium vinaceum]
MTVTEPPAAPPRLSRADLGLLVCCAGAGFATLLDSVVVTYAVPLLGTTLDAPTSGVQWFLSIYSLTFGLGLVPGGRLGDAHGRRTLFIAGLVVFAVGALAACAAPGIWWAVTGRAVQGLGAGLISAQVLGIIQDRFSGLRRVRALAAYTGAGAAAAVVGPLGVALALHVLPDHLAWRAVLALNLPFVLAVLLLTARFVPRRSPAEHRISLDLPAIVLVGAFVVLVTWPVIDPGIGGGRLWAVVAVCAALAVGTVAWERRYAARGRTPLFVPQLMASPGFVTGNLIALLWFGGLLAHSTVLTVYLLQGRGWSPLVVAAVQIPGALARIAASSASSRVYARFGVRTLPIALVIQAGATAVLATVSASVGGATLIATVIAAELLLGSAAAVLEPPLRAITLSFAPPTHHGVAAAFLQLTQRLSATFCIALVTGVALGGDLRTVSAVGVRHGLLICFGLVLAAGLLSFSRALRGTPEEHHAPAQTAHR